EIGDKQCNRRKFENEVERVRTQSNLSYAEDAKKAKIEKGNVSEELRTAKKVIKEPRSDTEFISVDKGRFLAFVAMVINCAKEIESKTDRIRMVVHAAKEVLGITDVKGEEIQEILGRGFGESQMQIN
ncbi:hypothetical protein GJAV_G00086790, partial [Gymnothorax javanicus]